jgi:hypothetical protein
MFLPIRSEPAEGQAIMHAGRGNGLLMRDLKILNDNDYATAGAGLFFKRRPTVSESCAPFFVQ